MTGNAEVGIATMAVRAGTVAEAFGRAIHELEQADASRRLWAGDPRLFTPDAAHDASIRGRLGWLRAPAEMKPRLEAVRAFAAAAAADGLRAAVLLGMGGSSLCAEVLERTFGARGGGGLPLHVLDSTDPAAVRAVEAEIELARTLYIVASKSGTTLEVKSFEAHFWERVAAATGAAGAGRNFCAVTDPATSLAKSAAAKGYRAAFENPADIGGRYSALSLFGLVPAALLGMDLEALVGSGAAMAKACGPDVAPGESPGVALGALLGAAAAAGKDKLTFIASPELSSFGSWAEQLVAESTGKEGRGIVPVDEEPLDAPERYGDDRVFAFLLLEDGAGTEGGAPLRAHADALAARGHPVVTITLADRHQIGGELFRWEVATAIAGARLGVNPFDEPNVTEAKNETAKVLAQRARGETPALPAPVRPGDQSALAALVASAAAGDYLCVSAYFLRTPVRHAALARLRAALRARSAARNATTLGYGPRFLHSTGQLHKGGANNGVFLQLTARAGADLPIPGETFTFGQLRDAQADGDLAVLLRRGRRALRVDLGTDGTIDAGLEALLAALG